MLEVEVVPDTLGKPEVKLHGYYAEFAQKLGVRNICLSLSHSRENAIAFVTME